MFSWLFDKYQKVTLDSDQVELFHQRMDQLEETMQILYKERELFRLLLIECSPYIQFATNISGNRELLDNINRALENVESLDELLINSKIE